MTTPLQPENLMSSSFGVGGSACSASLQLAWRGPERRSPVQGIPHPPHTVAAQGGVSASLGNMSEDSWEFHFYDTVKGSDWLGDQDAIEFMCREAPWVVYDLEHMGMPFDRNPDGTILPARPFGGHTANYGEKPSAARLRCSRPYRSRHAAHAVPGQRRCPHLFLWSGWRWI